MGYYKIHPEIPSELSERAKSFILRCFEPNPDIRATAAELLEDPFLNEYINKHSTVEFYNFLQSYSKMLIYYRKKKSNRLVAPPDFSRSISVPADRVERLGKCDKTNNNHIVSATPMQMSQSDDRYYKIFHLCYNVLCVSIFVICDILAFVLLCCTFI